MEDGMLGLTPLILLPGVALLAMSVSIRYGRIHDELHALEMHEGEQGKRLLPHLLRRARLFRDALAGLYVAAALLALAALLGGMAAYLSAGASTVAIALTLTAVATLVVATVFLVRETAISFGVFREHAARIEGR